jgi:hypothetical protein
MKTRLQTGHLLSAVRDRRIELVAGDAVSIPYDRLVTIGPALNAGLTVMNILFTVSISCQLLCRMD